MPRLAGFRHRLEHPDLGTGPCIERAHTARRAVRPDDQQVLERGRRRVVHDPHLDLAAGAERGRFAAARRIERHETPARREEHARLDAELARPIGDAAARRRSFGKIVAPSLVAGVRTQCDHSIRRRDEHHAADDDRGNLGPAAPSSRSCCCGRADSSTRAASRRRCSRRSESKVSSACRQGHGCSSASRRLRSSSPTAVGAAALALGEWAAERTLRGPRLRARPVSVREPKPICTAAGGAQRARNEPSNPRPAARAAAYVNSGHRKTSTAV